MTNRRTVRYIAAAALVSACQPLRAQAPATDEAKPAAPKTPPAWAAGARWYQVDVPFFANGDPSNDASGTLGDLQGLQSRLPYLSALGVDTLYLTSVFHHQPGDANVVDWLHIDPAISVKADTTPKTESPPNRHKTAFTEGDRTFIAFVRGAHAAGFRIVLDVGVGRVPQSIGPAGECLEQLTDLSRRWLDPDADGDPQDGVNGFVLRGANDVPPDSARKWCEQVRRISAAALLVADAKGDAAGIAAAGGFDTFVDRTASEAVREFIAAPPAPMDSKRFVERLGALPGGADSNALHAAPIGLSGPSAGRFFRPTPDAPAVTERTPRPPAEDSAASPSPRSTASLDNPESRWVLATMLQHFLPGSPMTYYGDEVGMAAGPGSEPQPLPGNDPTATGADSDMSHGAFATLLQWLHTRRAVDSALRSGELRVVLDAPDTKVLALGRVTRGAEVILVVNYGESKQRVMLPTDRPGQLAVLLSLNLHPDKLPPVLARTNPPPTEGIQPARVGANRQQVGPDGRTRVWVDPMSVRYVLLEDR